MKRIISLLITLSILLSFSGCNIDEKADNPDASTYTTDSSKSESTETSSSISDTNIEIPSLTEQQKNSFSMLYYLAITAEDIRVSKDNRLILNDIYTSLLNDINPGAIDEITQDHLKNLRDIIKSYINISIKRDRLQYIHNQDKAGTIRSLVPNPLAILSMTNSFDWKRLATSVLYTVVDSYSKFKDSNESVDQEFLMSGWELDDEETKTIQNNRERAFDYMVDIVQEYGLDGQLTLNEKDIETYTEICKIESVQQRIRRLESEQDTYKLLGDYWLKLAEAYYETSQFNKCLACVDKYNELATGIYRKDYNYANVLPKIIVAAQNTYSGKEYIANVEKFTDALVQNTTTEDWSVRYFAAQVYLDLYARTTERTYIEKAYNIAYDNMTILLDEQIALNKTYLSEVSPITISEPDYRFLSESEKKSAEKAYKEELKRLKSYNKLLKKNRETELPPLYEPLVLNCDLLFALAKELNIGDSEKAEIEAILQTKTNGVFLSKPTNEYYSFNKQMDNYDVEVSKNEIVIPVNLLSVSSKINVAVTDNDNVTKFDDFIVKKVERKDSSIDSFKAFVYSQKMKGYKWTNKSKVVVTIDNGENPIVLNYKVVEHKSNWIFPDKVEFEKE